MTRSTYITSIILLIGVLLAFWFYKFITAPREMRDKAVEIVDTNEVWAVVETAEYRPAEYRPGDYIEGALRKHATNIADAFVDAMREHVLKPLSEITNDGWIHRVDFGELTNDTYYCVFAIDPEAYGDGGNYGNQVYNIPDEDWPKLLHALTNARPGYRKETNRFTILINGRNEWSRTNQVK